MAKVVRRAAKKAALNAKDGHGLLGLLIFDEKLVYEQFTKLVEAKSAASLSMLKWAKQEDNIALQDVFSKVFEVSCIWTTAMKRFTEKYFQYRVAFKDVLHEEREVDDLRKKEVAYTTRLNKLQRQLDHTKRKSADLTKSKPLLDEMTEILAKVEESRAELEVRVTKHEIYKAMKLRDALFAVSDSIKTLAEQTLSVSASYRQLAETIPDTPTHLSEEKVFPEIGQTRQIVTGLAKELGVDPEVATVNKTAKQTYLYAVSRVAARSGEDGTPWKSTDYNDGSREPRSPPPRPERPAPRKISDQGGLASQHFARPFSLDDLRPPPSCPPPPVPISPGPLSPDSVNRLSPPYSRRSKLTPLLVDQKFGRPLSLNDLSVRRPKAISRDRNISGKSIRPRLNSADTRQDPNDPAWYARSAPIDESDDESSDGYTEPKERIPPPRKPRSPIKKQRAFRKGSEGLYNENNYALRQTDERGGLHNESHYAQRTSQGDAGAVDSYSASDYQSLHRSNPDIFSSQSSTDRSISGKSIRPRLNSADTRQDPNNPAWYARSAPIDESDGESSDGYTEPKERIPPPRKPRSPIKKQRAFRKGSEGLYNENNYALRQTDERGGLHNESHYAQRTSQGDAGAVDSYSASDYQSLHRSNPDIFSSQSSTGDYLELFNS